MYFIICLRNADSRYVFHLKWTHYVTFPVYNMYLLTATDAARRLVLMKFGKMLCQQIPLNSCELK